MKLGKSLQKQNTIKPENFEQKKLDKISLNFFGEQNDKLYTGSKLGILLSIFAVIMVLVYLVNVIIQMSNNEFDNLMSVTVHNDFEELGKVFVMKSSNILPIIQLNFNNLDSKFDLFDDNYKHIADPNQKKINYKKLSNYFKIQVVMTNRKNGISKSIISDYRLCRNDDFLKIQENQRSKVNSLKFFCVNQDEKLKEQMVLRDGYIGTLDERDSFSVEFVKTQGIKPDQEFVELFRSIIFTQYVIQDQADLSNYSNLAKNPIVSRLKFLQQFQLSLLHYRDNNNFVRYNKVETQDNQYINTYQSEYEYYDVVPQPVWYGNYGSSKESVSYDGQNYQMEERYLLSGQFFFLADERIEHSRQIATYLDVMSILGGFASLVFSVTAFMTSSISYQYILLNIIKKVYRKNLVNSQEGTKPVIEINDRRINKFRKSVMFQKSSKGQQLTAEDYETSLKFTTLDIITDIWLFKPLQYIFRNTRFMKNHKLFQILKSEIQQDIEVSNIVLNNKLLFLLNDEFNCFTQSQQNFTIPADDVNIRNETENRNSIISYDDYLRNQVNTPLFSNENYESSSINPDHSPDKLQKLQNSHNVFIRRQQPQSMDIRKHSKNSICQVIEEELQSISNGFDQNRDRNVNRLEQNQKTDTMDQNEQQNGLDFVLKTDEIDDYVADLEQQSQNNWMTRIISGKRQMKQK